MHLRLKPILIGTVGLLVAVYAYDYFSVRHRMAKHSATDPLDVVTYPHVLSIPLKGNRTIYELDANSPMESDPCVHSLFPHFGDSPCWYLTRHPDKLIDI